MKSKKKIIAAVFMGLLVLALVPVAIFAGYDAKQGQDVGYADINGYGICADFVDVNDDGICDNHGSACADFVDANGDGICDNHGNMSMRHHSDHGMGHHGGGHHGCRW